MSCRVHVYYCLLVLQDITEYGPCFPNFFMMRVCIAGSSDRKVEDGEHVYEIYSES